MSKIKLNHMLIVGILIEGFVVVLANLRYETSAEILQAMARFSGRFSLFIFLFTFMIASFHLNAKHRTYLQGIEIEKRLVGTFAIMHLIHFGFLASFIYVSGTELIVHRLLGGILAYLLIVSYPIYIRRADLQSKQFRILRRVYYYYVIFVFFMTYLPRIMGTLPNVGGTTAEFVMNFSLVLTTFAFHIYLVLKPPYNLQDEAESEGGTTAA